MGVARLNIPAVMYSTDRMLVSKKQDQLSTLKGNWRTHGTVKFEHHVLAR